MSEHKPRHKDPFEIMFSAVLALSASVQLVFGAAPDSIASLLWPWALTAWVLMSLVGSVAVLAGSFWRNPITGMFIESVGLSAVSLALVMYGGAILVVTLPDGRSLASGLLTIMLGVAFGWKRIQLRSAIRRLPT